MALLAAAIYATGLAIEQRALARLPALDPNRVPHFVATLARSPRWLGGFALAATGAIGLVVALSLAPVSVAQPVFAAGMSLMILFYAVLLGDPITRGERVALLLMPVALLLLFLSLGPADEHLGTRADLRLLYVVTASTVLGCVLALALVGRQRRAAASAVLLGAAAGLMQGVAGLQAKGLGGLLADHGPGGVIPAALASPYPYLYGVAWAIGIVLFQTSLQRSRASITAPVANVVGNVFVVLLGTIVFSEGLPGDPYRLTLRVLGILAIFAVILLMPSTPRTVGRASDPETSVQQAQ